MGQFIYCDLCGGSIPTANSMQEIKIGNDAVAGACYNCAQKLRTSIQTQKYAVMKDLAKPATVPAPQQQAQPQAEEKPAEQK